MSRSKWFISLLQRYGAPHEESLVIPTMFAIAILRRSEIGWTNGDLGAIYCLVMFALCGIWLGLAWVSENAIRVAFRAYYIGILIAAGYGALTSKHHTIEEYANFAVVLTQVFGGTYFAGWMIGSTTRQLIFLTDAERSVGKRRRRAVKSFIRTRLFRISPLPEVCLPTQNEAGNRTNGQKTPHEFSGAKSAPRVTIFRLSLPKLKTNKEKISYALSLLLISLAIKVLVLLLTIYLGRDLYEHMKGLRRMLSGG